MTRYSFEPGGIGPGRRFDFPALRGAVRVFILACVAVQVVEFILRGKLGDWLGLRATAFVQPPYLGPLQLFTYQFIHSYTNLVHLVFNMIALYFFGGLVEGSLGTRRFVCLYLACGVGGGLLWMLGTLFAGMTDVPVVGASGCIFGCIGYGAMVWPNLTVYMILVPVRLWMIAAGLAIFSLYAFALDLREGTSGSVAHSAHLGGMICGWCYWRFAHVLDRFGVQFEAQVKRRREQKRASHERELDELLVKVKQVGLPGLTERERKRLTALSRERDG